MNKKNVNLFSFFSGLFLLSVFGFLNSSVEASTVGTFYYRCSTPSSSTVYEKVPPAGSSSQQKVVHSHTYENDHSKPIKNGSGDIIGFEQKQIENDETSSVPCTSSLSSTTGSAYSGTVNYRYKFTGSGSNTSSYVTHKAYYINKIDASYSPNYKLSTDSTNPTLSCLMSYPDGNTTECPTPYSTSDTGKVDDERKICTHYSYNSRNASPCYTIYYATDVTITVSTTSSRTDQEPPTFKCIVTFKNNATKDCASNMTKSTSTSNGGKTIKTCYSYSLNGYSDTKCTDRHHLKELTISGPKTTYSGIKVKYYCIATFADNSTLNLSLNSDVWSAVPYNHIGSNNHPGYKRPIVNNVLKPTDYNEFYPTVNVDTNYTVKCSFNPYKSNSQVKDSSSLGINENYSVKNKGVKEMYISVSGNFYDSNNPGNFIKKEGLVSPDLTDVKYVPNANFLTGGWYDFRSYIKYTDGSDGNGSSGFREITNSPETLWTQTGVHPVQKSYNTNFPNSGLDNRIPVNGRNSIYSMFLYKGNPGDIVTNNRTRDGIIIWARQIVDLKIKGDNYSSPAKTTVSGGETVGYTAWVTFSDDNNNAVVSTRNPFGLGVKENWTSGVTWKGDYKARNGVYKFPRGDGQEISIYAYFNDVHSLKEAYDYWDSHSDYKIIKIIDDCSNLNYIVEGCSVPNNLWNTSGFSTEGDNFLPPARFYGYNEWNATNDPYRFIMRFKVTGISNSTNGNGINN